jgi:hypothetical protein
MLFNPGFRDGCMILLSYLRARLFPEKNKHNFEQWVTPFPSRLNQSASRTARRTSSVVSPKTRCDANE